MKKFMMLLILTFFFATVFTSSTTCLAYESLRVAILPVFNSSNTYDDDTERVIAESLQARFRMPLAKVITLYDVIPGNKVQLALPPELKNRNNPGKIEVSMLKDIGKKLKADVVIWAQIMDFTSFTFSNWEGDLFQQTDLTIRVIGYDTKKDEFLELRDSQHYHDEASVWGNPDYLATQIMEHLMNKIPYTWKH